MSISLILIYLIKTYWPNYISIMVIKKSPLHKIIQKQMTFVSFWCFFDVFGHLISLGPLANTITRCVSKIYVFYIILVIGKCILHKHQNEKNKTSLPRRLFLATPGEATIENKLHNRCLSTPAVGNIFVKRGTFFDVNKDKHPTQNS